MKQTKNPMKKRTKFLSVLFTLVMLLGMVLALGTTAFAARNTFFMHVGENIFVNWDIKAA
ncbi:MAG: hypothetical protein MR935_07590 [Agathobaculum sp.]|uniref:hypothetical protein n=1 Tax=Agathobaculum sp. TaxID=2048138 RepID=UPI0025C044CF|nr:hypothetical protein [Agathobaculum sp.]MCI7126036.1 hypothetical protein [Agathobaculum sp.]